MIPPPPDFQKCAGALCSTSLRNRAGGSSHIRVLLPGENFYKTPEGKARLDYYRKIPEEQLRALYSQLEKTGPHKEGSPEWQKLGELRYAIRSKLIHK